MWALDRRKNRTYQLDVDTDSRCETNCTKIRCCGMVKGIFSQFVPKIPQNLNWKPPPLHSGFGLALPWASCAKLLFFNVSHESYRRENGIRFHADTNFRQSHCSTWIDYTETVWKIYFVAQNDFLTAFQFAWNADCLKIRQKSRIEN